MAAGKALAVHFYLPWGDQPRLPLDALNPKPLIALDGVVWLDLLDHLSHPLHHGGKIGAGVAWAKAQLVGFTLLCGKAGASDQRLGGDTAAVEAISPHLVLLDESHLGLHRCRDIAGNQPTCPGTDHQQVVVIASGFAVRGEQAPLREVCGQFLDQPGHQPEQGQRDHQAGGEDIAGAG